MSMVKHLTTDQFETEVLSSNQPVLVDFYATWCPPCKMIAPALDTTAREFDGRVKIVKVNVEEEYSLADRYQIEGVPTLILFRDGRMLEKIVGAPSPRVLHEKLAQAATQISPGLAPN